MVGSEDELVAHARSRVGLSLRGKYRLDRVLGVGGMAAVYEASHRNGHRVAIKMLHGVYSVRPEIRTRFLREGHAANAVGHPGAVVVIDDDVAEDGSAYIVMELLEGDVVERLWARSNCRLSPELVLGIAFELCDVLDAAHRAGVVHRDIKPENLFLTREGELKVLDFGLAQLRDIGPKLTATGAVFGTPAFMAPEQASGRTSQVDAQSDIWAVGATMYTLLTGATVHEGETGQHLMVLAATKPAKTLSAALPGVAPDLARIVDGALAFEKSRRWSSAAAMQAAIRSAGRTLYGAPPNLRALASDDVTRVQRVIPSAGSCSPSEAEADTDVLRVDRLPNLASSGDSTLTDHRRQDARDATEAATPIYRQNALAAGSVSDDAETLRRGNQAAVAASALPPLRAARSARLGRFLDLLGSARTASEGPTLSQRLANRLEAIRQLAPRVRRQGWVTAVEALLLDASASVRAHRRESLLVLAVGAMAVLSLVVGVSLAVRRSGRHDSGAASGGASAVPLVVVPSALTVSGGANATAPPASSGAESAPPQPRPDLRVNVDQPAESSVPSVPISQAVSPRHPTPPPTAHRTAPRSSSPVPPLDSDECSPPYIFTPEGWVVWKPACKSPSGR